MSSPYVRFFSGPWALSGYVHVVCFIDSLNRTIAFLFMCSKCFTFADRSILQNIVWCWWWWWCLCCCCCCDCGSFKCHSLWRKLAVRLCLFSVSWWMILIMLQMFDPCSFKSMYKRLIERYFTSFGPKRADDSVSHHWIRRWYPISECISQKSSLCHIACIEYLLLHN